MKAKDVLTIATVALGTATITVLTFWSPGLEAGNEDNPLAALIAKPKLVADGIEMTLATAEGRTFKAGEQPVFDLKAINTTGQHAATIIQLVMTASSPQDMNSRLVRPPAFLCRQEQTVTLTANETKVIRLSTGTKLPGNSMIHVSLQKAESPTKSLLSGSAVSSVLQAAESGPAGIVAMNFSTVTNAPQTLVREASPAQATSIRVGEEQLVSTPLAAPRLPLASKMGENRLAAP
jgi:hypothetical protein